MARTPKVSIGGVSVSLGASNNPARELADLAKKYSRVAGQVIQDTGQAPSAAVLAPLIAKDKQRLDQHASSVNRAQTIAQAKAGQQVGGTQEGPFFYPSSQASTPPPKGPGFVGQQTHDLGSIIAGMLNPVAIFGGAMHIGEQVAHGDPAALLNLIPGSAEVKDVATGHAGELLKHPFYTLMDALPWVAGGINHLNPEFADAARAAGKSPLKAGMEAIAGKTLGWADSHIDPRISRFTPGELMDRNFGMGGDARATSEGIGITNRKFRLFFEQATRQLHAELAKYGLSKEAMVDLVTKAERGDKGWRQSLHPAEEGVIDTYMKFLNNVTWLTEEYATHTLKRPAYAMWKGEFWSSEEKSVARNIKNYKDLVQKRANLINLHNTMRAKALELAGDPMLRQSPVEVSHPESLHEPRRYIGGPTFEREYRAMPKKIAAVEKAIAAQELKVDSLVKGRPPDRYLPRLWQDMGTKLKPVSRGRLSAIGASDAQIAKAMEALDRGQWTAGTGLEDREVMAMKKEVFGEWQALKERGIDPMFVHHLSERQLGVLQSVRVNPKQIVGLTATKARGFNLEPWVKDLEIALSHQAWEFERQKFTQQMLDQWRKDGQITDRETTRNAYFQKFQGKVSDLKLAKMFDADYKIFNPEAHTPIFTRGVKPMQLKFKGGVGRGEELIPAGMAKVLESMSGFRDMPLAKVRNVNDRALDVFRMSVLGLSPTYMIHVGLTNALLMTQMEGLHPWKFFGKAWGMLRDGKLDPRLALHMQDSYTVQTAVHEFAKGKTLGRWIGARSKMYTLTTLMHDMYRSMAFLSGEDKAIRAGMSDDAAIEAGLRTANRVLGNLDRMTPFEREVIRQIIPFYSWNKYLMQFAISYPIDHPLRAAITSNFARNEINDQGNGLPDTMQRLLLLGKPDSNGNINGMSYTGLVPFLNVGNYFTAAGFFSHLNPMLKGVLSIFGVDPFQGNTDLHPELTYNPETGQMQAIRPGVVGSLLGGLVPQTNLLQDLLFQSQDMRTLHETDPGAYWRKIYTDMGLRMIPTKYNLIKKAESAEAARYQSLQKAISAALKQGNYRELEQYPQFMPLIQLLRGQLAAGQTASGG